MDWIKWDEEYVWHPFTQAQTESNPIPVERAEGVWLYTPDGKKYLDANSSWWVNVHGHNHPELKEAIRNQIEKLQHVIFAGITHEPAATLAKKLLEWMPGCDKVFFSDNGSTAVEVALKMAFQYFDNKGKARNKVLAIQGAYHGDTFGAMSVSERDVFNRPFERHFFSVDFIDFPTKENEEAILQDLKVKVQSGEYAAFIFEPLVQGAAGMRMYSAEFLQKAIEICEEADVLTVADEIMTGFGRTGKMFALDHIDSNADIVCLSKGLTAGYLPLGLTVTTNKLYDTFLAKEKRKGFLHGHSFTGNPIACALSCVNLEIFSRDETWEQIDVIQSAHENFIKGYDLSPHKVRMQGTILAVEFESADSGYFNPTYAKAYEFFKEKGLIVRPLGNVVFVNPPYCISQEELNLVYASIEEFSRSFN